MSTLYLQYLVIIKWLISYQHCVNFFEMGEFCGMGEFFQVCTFDWNWFALRSFSIENNQCFISISECHQPSQQMCMISLIPSNMGTVTLRWSLIQLNKVLISFSSSGSANTIWAYIFYDKSHFHKNMTYCIIHLWVLLYIFISDLI